MKKLLSRKSLILFIFLLFIITILAFVFLRNREIRHNYSNTNKEVKCNVQGIKVRGTIVHYIPKSDLSPTNGQLNVDETASEDVYRIIKKAEKDSSIKAIIIDIDSAGGSGEAAKEIEMTLKRSNKPSVAILGEVAESGGYWISTGANVIFASNISSVGKIGVNGSYLDNVQKNIQDGYAYHSITTGVNKDLGDPNKPITKAEEQLMRDHIKFVYDDFTKTVAINRKLSLDKVKSLADGSSFYGGQALNLGLVDKLGTMDDANDYIKTTYLNGQEVNVCW